MVHDVSDFSKAEKCGRQGSSAGSSRVLPTCDIIGPTGKSLGYSTMAAKAGDSVELFGVGFGATTPAVPAGHIYSGAAATSNTVTLLINNVNLTPAFTGLSSAGLYQINFADSFWCYHFRAIEGQLLNL
jgi:uncharacterized protein (TIGR03437 family)